MTLAPSARALRPRPSGVTEEPDAADSTSQVAAVVRICSTSVVAAPTRQASTGSGSATSAGLTGEREQLNQLIRAHSAYVAGLAFRLLGRDEEVDDVVQDVFVSFFRFYGDIREPSALRAWLATTTVRVARRRLRLRRIGLLLRLQDRVDPSELCAQGATPEDTAVLTSIHRVLDRVSVNERLAWALRYLEQERIEDVARLCGCSTATAKRRIAAAHVVVRRALGDA